MSCLNVAIELSNSTPIVKVFDRGAHLVASCSLVCSVGFGAPSYSWSEGVRLLWDNGSLVLLDSE